MKTSLILISICLLAVSTLAAETVSFTVVGIDCKECSGPILKALSAVPSVKNVKLDWKKGLATVDIPPGFDKAKLRTALTDLGFEAIFPGEKRKDLEALPPDVVKKLDITVANGKSKIDVARTVVPGKITILDFYADWCGPCHVLEARLQHLMVARKHLALRRVNVGNWDNAAATQATREFRAEGLPYVRVYDAKGRFVRAVGGGMWDAVLAAIEEAEKRV